MPAFCQRLFRQNSLNQDLPKFNNAKVSSFTVISRGQTKYKRLARNVVWPREIKQEMERSVDSLRYNNIWLNIGVRYSLKVFALLLTF